MSTVDLSTYGGALLEVGYAGQIVDLNTASIISRSNESATAIDFGGVVVRGAADNTCKPIAATNDSILGIAVRHPIQVSSVVPGSTPDIKYARSSSVAILEVGRIFVTAGANVTRGNAVYSTAAGVLTDVSSGNAAIPGAVWDTTTTNGNIGVIRIAK